MQASATAAQKAGPDTAYWRFHDAVAQAQLTSWLAGPSRVLIDISGSDSPAATLAVSAGHRVLHVVDPDAITPGTARPRPATRPAASPAAMPESSLRPRAWARRPGRLARTLRSVGRGRHRAWSSWLTQCADGVIAEDRALSRRLAAETLVSEMARTLRPGSRVLSSVDSLTRGMAVLAEQHHWPHLVDLPHADVVLVPWPDGSITRCYGTEQLRELFTSGGFEVHWIHPRTVLSPSTVSYLLARDPSSFRRLVEAELRTSADDSVGGQLVISATKSAARQRLAGLAATPIALGLAGHAARSSDAPPMRPSGNGCPQSTYLAVAAVLHPG